MKIQRIEKEWLEYRKHNIPRDAAVFWTRQAKRAFYSGAISVLAMLEEAKSSDDLVRRTLGQLWKDLNEFGDQAERGEDLRRPAGDDTAGT